jgi:hypothetical protein
MYYLPSMHNSQFLYIAKNANLRRSEARVTASIIQVSARWADVEIFKDFVGRSRRLNFNIGRISSFKPFTKLRSILQFVAKSQGISI